MKVSVIVPLYNKQPYVRRALDSILGQTVADFEVIVVDDGSTDSGPVLVSECRDPRVRLIAQGNAGPGAARNRGLREAAGEYVAFLDADDEWLPTFLATSLALLEAQGEAVAAVVSGYFEFPSGHSTERLWRRRGLRDGVYRINSATPPRLVVSLLAYLSPWSTVTRAEVVRRWGGFFDRGRCLYGEDSYLWIKVLLNETVLVNTRPLVRYHREASALSQGRRGPRPVEPLLTAPEGLEAVCPAELRDLLARVLTRRAIKTASMLGYWGQWRQARSLLDRYCPWSALRLPGYWPARVCASPLGPRLGSTWRKFRAVSSG